MDAGRLLQELGNGGRQGRGAGEWPGGSLLKLGPAGLASPSHGTDRRD